MWRRINASGGTSARATTVTESQFTLITQKYLQLAGTSHSITFICPGLEMFERCDSSCDHTSFHFAHIFKTTFSNSSLQKHQSLDKTKAVS